ncbi:MAG: Stk1 family PASTA domain-containing Ser/Thr kinase [Oscillospiraceae bacterium]|nr:Stk1 family PASTA domain-containing Ser/Thr kinase [Oscillospiraceae bacterium]
MDKYLGKMLDNRYEIVDIIGVGGMAVVYKAKCHRLNRLVALKILKDDYAQDADFKRRFHAESQAVAMLSHPNIVAVYDVSRSGNVEYIVMELIDGITLKQYMSKKGKLSWREVLHFSTQITKALIHAHSRGIIHRDIKPHNIMILRDGSVKVADFGIARFSNKQNTLTQEALGSVHYISPEQARGSHIDARSDIYSVGVVMYEMLSMRLPYEGDSPVSVAIQHINSIPLTPREIDPGIPEALETITMKAMSASLSKRYPSAEALLQDLEEFRKNPSISFDYDISELMARDEDEPTKKLPGVAAVPKQNVKKPRPEETNDEDDEVYRARRRNKSLTMITGLASVLIFILAMFYLVLTFLGNLTDNDGLTIPSNDDTVEVPNLINALFTEISNDREKYGDFIIEATSDGEYSGLYDEGRIIRQDPASGRRVKKGATITVTVSRGVREFSLPSLNGYEYRQAQSILAGKDINLNFSLDYETSDTVVRDHVIRTEPPAGELVREGQVIKLIVSNGAEPVFVKVPNLVGMPYEEAERELDHLELIPSVVEMESEQPAGEIIWQSIPGDTEVETRTEIQLQVSLGPAEPPPDPNDPDPNDPTPNPDDPTPDPDDPTPPPDPGTPTPAQDVTAQITVTLPGTPGTTNLVIRRNAIIVISEEVNNSLGQVTYTVTGQPSDSVDIYFDGDLQFTRPLVQ